MLPGILIGLLMGFFDIITEKLGLFKCYFTSSFTTTVQLAKIF